MFSCEFSEIFTNTFFYRTPPDDCFWKYNHLTTCCFSSLPTAFPVRYVPGRIFSENFFGMVNSELRWLEKAKVFAVLLKTACSFCSVFGHLACSLLCRICDDETMNSSEIVCVLFEQLCFLTGKKLNLLSIIAQKS